MSTTEGILSSIVMIIECLSQSMYYEISIIRMRVIECLIIMLAAVARDFRPAILVHNYKGHNYIRHNSIGHNYVDVRPATLAELPARTCCC